MIDNENYDSAYEPQFHICVDSNMSAEVESRDHAIKMFNRYTYNLFKGAVKLIDYKVPRGSSLAIAKCSARLIFDTVEDLKLGLKIVLFQLQKLLRIIIFFHSSLNSTLCI